MAMARMLSRATKVFGRVDLLGIVDVHQHQHMEIAVADMADDRRDQPHLGDVGLGLGDAFGKPRDRHADIGRQPLGAGPQRQRRPVGVVPRLPQLRPLLGDCWSTGTARRHIPRRSRRTSLGLLGNAGVAAVEFDEQARASPDSRAWNSSIIARICSALTSSMRATGMPIWIVAMTAVAGRLDARERADAAGDRLRDALQLQRQRRDDAERAFRADQQPRQIIAGRALFRALAGRDRLGRRP